jgi:hypothetical protein
MSAMAKVARLDATFKRELFFSKNLSKACMANRYQPKPLKLGFM